MPDILYEDNHVLVAFKPPNMLSQADATGDTDLLTLVKAYVKEKYHKPGDVYIGLVHRLDRPVGGLMVFARTSKAAARLSAQLQAHRVGRAYLCVAEGMAPEHFTHIDYLLKDSALNRVEVVEAARRGAQEAILHGELLACRDGLSLCRIRLETGRPHQIRVQMASHRLPLWGDNRYGSGLPGQQVALWGDTLSFEHPTTHQLMSFQRLPAGGIWTRFEEELRREEAAFREQLTSVSRTV